VAYGSDKSFIDWHNIFIEMLRLQGLTREVCLPNKGKVFTSSECNQFVICRWGNFLHTSATKICLQSCGGIMCKLLLCDVVGGVFMLDLVCLPFFDHLVMAHDTELMETHQHHH
jgi:hypothetical protein